MASVAPINVRALIGIIAGVMLALMAVASSDDLCANGSCGVVSEPLFTWLYSAFGPWAPRILLLVGGIWLVVSSWRSLWPQDNGIRSQEPKDAI
jgi:hypothetical protein